MTSFKSVRTITTLSVCQPYISTYQVKWNQVDLIHKMKLFQIFFVFLLAVMLLGCGGGGGSSSSNDATRSPTPTPLSVATSSYANKNGISLDAPQIPNISTTSPVGNSIAESLTFGDFFQNGTYSAFVAVSQFGGAAKAYFLKKSASGIWEDDTTSLLSDRVVCQSVVQSITADLNGDGKPDVYVVCGGAGALKQVLFVSQANTSSYVRQETSFTLQQSWGAAAGDIDGDGDIDLVVTDNGQAIALMNDGTRAGASSFSKDGGRIPTTGSGQDFPTLHRKVFLLPRTNAKPDLVIGGSGAANNITMVYLKNDNGHYYVNHSTGVSNVFENKMLGGVTAQLYDLVETNAYLYVLAKNAPVENASSASVMSVLRYELPSNNQSATPINLANLNGTELALPSNVYNPTGGFVSQIKRNTQGVFVAFDGACVSSEQRCSFTATPP
jgi:hypothetical protein